MGECSLPLVTRIAASLNLLITLFGSILSVFLLGYAIVHKVDLRLYFLGLFVLLFFRVFEFATAIILVIYTSGDREINETIKWIWIWFYSNLTVFMLRMFLFKWMEPGILAIEMLNRFLSLTLVWLYVQQPANILSISAPIDSQRNTGTTAV